MGIPNRLRPPASASGQGPVALWYLLSSKMGSNGPDYPNARPPLVVKTTPLKEDFLVGSSVLGAGINGKVVECTERRSGNKCALKVIRDCAESRSEVELQWKASSCPQVVSLVAVYQKTEYTSHSMSKYIC